MLPEVSYLERIVITIFELDRNITHKVIRHINRNIRRIPIWYLKFYTKLRNNNLHNNFAIAKSLERRAKEGIAILERRAMEK